VYEKASKVFASAEELINGARQDSYGNATETARRVGMAWSALLGLGEPIPPFQVQSMMAMLKIVRGNQDPAWEDSWVDGAAYIGLAREAIDL
jgi:hypothetical protein